MTLRLCRRKGVWVVPPSRLEALGVVSSEIHEDPAVAFAVAHELGMGYVDIGTLWGKPVSALSTEELRRVRQLAERYGLQAVMVGPTPFKGAIVAGLSASHLDAFPPFRRDLEELEASLKAAKYLEARFARVFSFRWPHMQGLGYPSPRHPSGGEIPPDVLAVVAAGLRRAAELADRYGVDLALENVRSCYGNSGRNTRLIVDAVGHERLKVAWDPANAYVSGEERAYPEGYEAVRPYVRHVHVKDARVVDAAQGLTAWECVGRGAVDYVGQFRALAVDGYGGVLCLETHWAPSGLTPEAATRTSFAGLLEARRLALAGGGARKEAGEESGERAGEGAGTREGTGQGEGGDAYGRGA